MEESTPTEAPWVCPHVIDEARRGRIPLPGDPPYAKRGLRSERIPSVRMQQAL
jgi:hypothetical protein